MKLFLAALLLAVATPVLAQVTIEAPRGPGYGYEDHERYDRDHYRDRDRYRYGEDHRYGYDHHYGPRRHCYYAGGIRVCQ